MRVQSGLMVSLGHGRFVRSDDVVAVEPIVEGRGPGKRSLVWVRGLPNALVASRSEAAIVMDLIAPRSEAAAARQQRTALNHVVRSLDAVPALMRRVLREESGVDLDGLVEEATRALAA